MTLSRFLRIFWTFIWRFMMVYGLFVFIQKSTTFTFLNNVRLSQNAEVWLALISMGYTSAVLIIAGAYGLYAVLNAKYRHFDIDVRSDKRAEIF